LIFSCPFCLFSANQTLARGDYFLSRKKGNWLQRLAMRSAGFKSSELSIWHVAKAFVLFLSFHF
jgi:hypothetical protein